jgi:tRNA A-37 threonylcarbamoyl transferase component Bud32
MAAHLLPSIPGYQILELLHRGGQGMVYRAVQTVARREVAIKVIRPELLTDPLAVQRFQLEGRAAAQLQHPNIVTLYDMGQEGGCHFLVMELLDGVDLRTWVERSGPMPVTLACDCIRQAALGLQHASERGLIHRDLKPSNLLRTRDGLVKVLDLGLARLVPRPGEAAVETLTATGSLVGTADFMAPEQIDNPSRVDIRADLYSLGGTLYYLLSGQVPFPGESLARKLDGHRWHWPPPVEQLRPDVPSAMAALCRRLLSKHPEDRFDRPLDLAEVLATILQGLGPVPLGPPPGAGPLAGRRGGTPAETVPSVRQLPPGYVGECRCWRGHPGYISALSFTLSGQQVLSACLDGEVRLWDLATGTCRVLLDGPGPPVWTVCMAQDGRHAFVAGGDRTVRTFDLETGREVRCVPLVLAAEVDTIAMTRDGQYALVCGSDRRLRLWDLQLGRETCCLEVDPGEAGFHGLTFSADGRKMACGSRAGWVRLWEVAGIRELHCLRGHQAPVYSLDLSPDGRWLVSGSYDQTARLWDTDAGTEVRCFAGHQGSIRAVALAMTAGWLFTGGNDRTIRLWALASGEECCRLEGHTDHVTTVALAPDMRLAASGANDRTVRLWRLPSG